MRIGSSRSSLSSRTALIARIAASPRLTMARRVKGARVGVTPPLCDRRHPGASTRTAPRAPRSGRAAPAEWRGRPPSTSGIQGPRRAVLGRVTLERHELQLHGHRVSYRTAGSGPALLLLHGITNSSETWERAASLLAERFTLIAPDLLGHGESATPRGDYSLGAHASGARDVANALGHERVTVVGHSLGGGIAMQFAYQFPERTRAPGAGLQRRARPRGPPAAARRVAARRRLRAPRADLPAAGRARPRDRRSARPRRPRAGAATSGCSRAASPRSTTRARARRSCTRCAP